MSKSKAVVYVIFPDNDRGKSVSRVTVRATPVTDKGKLAGPDRDCAMIFADIDREAVKVLARKFGLIS
jgi:hypothetical protein